MSTISTRAVHKYLFVFRPRWTHTYQGRTPDTTKAEATHNEHILFPLSMFLPLSICWRLRDRSPHTHTQTHTNKYVFTGKPAGCKPQPAHILRPHGLKTNKKNPQTPPHSPHDGRVQHIIMYADEMSWTRIVYIYMGG